MSNTKRRNVTHRLATIDGGRLYVFTGLGEFRTAEQARARWQDSPRNGSAVILRSWDAVARTGIVYGLHEERLSVIDLSVLP